MNKKNLLFAEITGTVVVTIGIVFLWNIYELMNGATISVVFGAVNYSVWEKAKCISLCSVFFGVAELMCVKPLFRQYVVAKSLGISFSLLVFIVADSFWGTDDVSDFTILCVSVICGFFCSYLITVSGFSLRSFFVPACLLIMLIFMMTFSFTAFVPRLEIFRDPYTGCYGIIPKSFDFGAVSM